MGLSCRRFFIGRDDTFWRVPAAKFDRLLRDPAGDRLPAFAGQRVRMADVIVELMGRHPVRVVRRTFAVVDFDVEGCLDAGGFERRQFARAESLLGEVLSRSTDGANTVVDAAARFVAQGGAWTPSSALARAVNDAALGRRKCLRL